MRAAWCAGPCATARIGGLRARNLSRTRRATPSPDPRPNAGMGVFASRTPARGSVLPSRCRRSRLTMGADARMGECELGGARIGGAQVGEPVRLLGETLGLLTLGPYTLGSYVLGV